MILDLADLKRHLQPAFTEQQSTMLATCLYEYYQPIVHQREMAAIRDGLGRVVAAQEVTGQRIDRLTVAQELTGQRIDRHAIAQDRTEAEVAELVQVTKTLLWGQNDLRKQVGGIADSVGQGLEAYATERIPRTLEQRFGFVLESAAPETMGPAGNVAKIDVVCRGMLDGWPVAVLCEVKTNVTETEVREFLVTADRVRPAAGVDDVRILFSATARARPPQRLIAEYGCWLAFPRRMVVA